LHVGNASYLPVEDDLFDAAYHFGALNNFADRRRALEEMTRVVRPGGKVVVGDEGIAPWLRRRLYGRILIRTNKLYKHRPPLEMLPIDVREVAVRWLLGDAFYVIDFRVGEGPLPMDLDLPMPRKGDTLRSRYYGTPPKAPPEDDGEQ
jgi:SAM-dependent methyltransferase